MPEFKTKVKFKKPRNFTALVRLKQKNSTKATFKDQGFYSASTKTNQNIGRIFFSHNRSRQYISQPTKNE